MSLFDPLVTSAPSTRKAESRSIFPFRPSVLALALSVLTSVFTVISTPYQLDPKYPRTHHHGIVLVAVLTPLNCSFTMLPPLDTRILHTLSRGNDDDEEERKFDPRGHIILIKEWITEDGNWPIGVLRLLGVWPRIDPQFYRKKPISTSHPLHRRVGPNNWSIDFHVHFQFLFTVSATTNLFWDSIFKNLRRKPSSGGAINIYAFGNLVQSSQMIGCRRNLSSMIEWIWDYGMETEAVRSKQKGNLLLSPICSVTPLLTSSQYQLHLSEHIPNVDTSRSLCFVKTHQGATRKSIEGKGCDRGFREPRS